MPLVNVAIAQTIKAAALRQAAKYKNFVGLDMDDFFHGHADPSKVTPSSLWGHGESPAEAVVRPWDEARKLSVIAPAALSPRQFLDVQQELHTTAPKCRGKKLDLSIVWYTHQVHPSI